MKITQIPWILIIFRFAVSPHIIVMWLSKVDGSWFLPVLVLAVLSDIFDGVIARRQHSVTEKLRLFDSYTDALLFITVWFVIFARDWKLLIPYRLWMLTLIAVQLFSYLIPLIKFGRFPSYHAYTAKIWALGLLVSEISLLCYHTAGIYLIMAIGLGFLSNLDGITISIPLPEWKQDVKSTFVALRIRRDTQH